MAEDPYSSPLYLTLPGCCNDSWSQDVESGEISTPPAVGEAAAIEDPSEECSCPAEPGQNHGGRQNMPRHGLSVLMHRIRSISVTECSEDETNLIDGSAEDDDGDEVF